MGHIRNRSLRSESSDVIINFFDDFFQKTESINNSVTFKIPNKFTSRTENYFSTHLKVKSVKTRLQKSWKV